MADKQHFDHAEAICDMMAEASKVRGTGIAKRKPDYIRQKMGEGKAVIALDGDKAIGFCYIESWEDEKYVANSGLIVHPDYRKQGLAKAIKKATFNLSKEKFPNAKLFGITTSMATMKINSELGYTPVTFSELTTDEKFWKGCSSCTNYDILQRTNKTMCICTGMICDLSKVEQAPKKSAWDNFVQFVKQK
jgi:GNAT superfamily N-acetyltransferase